MAKYEYKPLAGGKRKSSNARHLILALVVIIIGTVVLIKTRGSDSGAKGTDAGAVGDRSEEYALPGESSSPVAGASGAGAGGRAEASGGAGAGKPTEGAGGVRTDTTAVLPLPGSASGNNNASTSTSEATMGLIEKALKQLEGGYVVAARDSLNTSLTMQMTDDCRARVRAKLTELAGTWLFSSTVYPGDTLTEMYTVQPGEMLTNIGKKFSVPYEILAEINGIQRPERLQAGQKIKVIKGPFNVKVYRSAFLMDLYLGSQMYVKSYRVGLGAVESETPPGRWRVKAGGKAIKPTWTDPVTKIKYAADHPEYPLGSRWIEIEGLDASNKARDGFAIHGTKEPDSIGKRSSMGCIRLFNGDAVEVYNLLYPEKSEVRIVD